MDSFMVGSLVENERKGCKARNVVAKNSGAI
jgi:hypothetical protein